MAQAVFWGALLSGSVSNARNIFAIYQDSRMQTANCIREVSSDPKGVLRRNGITYAGNPSTAEIAALAKGIGQIERLLGRPLPSEWQTKFNYINASGNWNQGVSAINVRRPRNSDKGQNTGRLMHELGHKVGNAGVYTLYENYMPGGTGLGNNCKISPYAQTKNNEEFAEVFEVFVVHPDLLAQKCPKAYEFFTEEIFPRGGAALATCNPRPAPQNLAERNRVTPKPPLDRSRLATQGADQGVQ